MMNCRCPKRLGFPEKKWELFDLLRPQKTWWQVEGLFLRHTGQCPLTDDFLRVRRVPLRLSATGRSTK